MDRQIYLGPNHPQARIVTSTIFKDGIPEDVEALLNECPSAKALLVPTQEAGKVLVELQKKGSVYQTLYAQTMEEFEKTLPEAERKGADK